MLPWAVDCPSLSPLGQATHCYSKALQAKERSNSATSLWHSVGHPDPLCPYLCPELVRKRPDPCPGSQLRDLLWSCGPGRRPAGVLTRDRLTPLPPTPPPLLLQARPAGTLRLDRLWLCWLRAKRPLAEDTDVFDTQLRDRAAREGKSDTAASAEEGCVITPCCDHCCQGLSKGRFASAAAVMAMGSVLACCSGLCCSWWSKLPRCW